MMAGMDDKNDIEDEITLESMNGLSRIMGKLGENNIRPILINICLRIRPCFEKVHTVNGIFCVTRTTFSNFLLLYIYMCVCHFVSVSVSHLCPGLFL